MNKAACTRKSGIIFLLVPLLFIAAGAPMTAFAQAYVPVIDIRMEERFPEYVAKFDQAITTAPDSLRNIIAGPNPQGVAAEECHRRDANDYSFAYKVGPWADAVASSSGYIPATIPEGGTPGNPTGYVQIIGQGQGGVSEDGNDSGSLRCILTALVGYQKIALYVQIQQLLKQYIADAQQQQLSNKLLNIINGTNLEWGKQGEKVKAGGMETTEPVYVLNSSRSEDDENGRTVNVAVTQAASAPGATVGSFELNDPLYVATQVAMNMQDETEDPRNSIVEVTRATLTVDEVDAYMDNPNTQTGSGAFFMLGDMFKNIQDTPLGASAIVRSETDRRIAQEKERRDKQEANSGFRPTKICSDRPDDVDYCDPAYMIDVSPNRQNDQVITGALESGNKQLESGVLDDTPATAAQNLSTVSNTEESGVYGYNTTPLRTTTTGVNELIRELYDTIQYAYFDLNADQEEWASAALLSIYDEMKFNPSTVQEVVTDQRDSLYVTY